MSDVIKLLPLLFNGESPLAHEIQYSFMDLVSSLYSINFSKRIGNWCKAHNVKYIGHVIEDNNAHARLGYGSGHFFRSMVGQDMAGIDIVLHQLLPEHNNGYFNAMTSTGWDGEFFHYALAEMGTSLGRLDPKKHGNTMCEVFGAFGWSEDLTFMKWIADHMLVRGVNNFVPHAFSMKEYPDSDCPPHFYAHGKNPQYKGMGELVSYMNKVSTIFSGGEHECNTAVLYHGEAEWSGKRMLDQKVTRKLDESQIGFEIVPSDYIIESSLTKKATFIINKMKFNNLIIPYSERLPKKLILKLIQLEKNNVNILFIGGLPKGISDDLKNTSLLNELIERSSSIELSDLIKNLNDLKIIRLNSKSYTPWLRFYSYKLHDGSVQMFFNESTKVTICKKINLKKKNWKIYDPTLDKIIDPVINEDILNIKLEPSQTLIIFQDDSEKNDDYSYSNIWETSLKDNKWDITFDGVGLTKKAPIEIKSKGLPLLGLGDEYCNFAGTVSYSTKINISKNKAIIYLKDVSGLLTISVNGKQVGSRIGTPYVYDISSYIKKGINDITITWTSSLGRYQRDYLSQYLVLGPLGITGDVIVKEFDF
ncbi:hypothetical protein ACYT32_03240 [Companilactobacillus sp. FL22-3]